MISYRLYVFFSRNKRDVSKQQNVSQLQNVQAQKRQKQSPRRLMYIPMVIAW